MKIAIILAMLLSTEAFSQSVLGRWKSIDEESGEETSVVELFQKGEKLYGKIIRIFPKQGEEPDPVCKKCDEDDSRYMRKIVGMEIIRNMKPDGQEYNDGDILDPKIGRVYKCKLWLEGETLKVRGYWGPFYRTQTWKKVH